MCIDIRKANWAWERLYSWRFQSDHDLSVYDKSVAWIGITDGTVLRVRKVMSEFEIGFQVGRAIASVVLFAATGIPDATLLSNIWLDHVVDHAVEHLIEHAAHHVLDHGVVHYLSPDIPSEIQEIREISLAAFQ